MARKQLTVWNTLPIGILYGLAIAGFPTVAVHAGTAIPSGATVTIDAHGVCKKVTNPGSGTRMVFTDSAGEWANFRSNPNGLTMNACTPSCGGKVVGGYCWYAAAVGQSCTQACTSRGGVDMEGTRNYAGSGGTNAQCDAVLTAIGFPLTHPDQTVEEATCVDGGKDLGCVHSALGEVFSVRFRCTGAPTTALAVWRPENEYDKTRRACACNN
jgi:hypothetical protein